MVRSNFQAFHLISMENGLRFVLPSRQSRSSLNTSELPMQVTSIPGPNSNVLHERKLAAVSNGVGTVLPAYIKSSHSGVLIDVDGNVLIDLGSGIGVTGVGNANAEVVAAIAEQAKEFTHTAFAVTPYEGYVRVCELLNELTPGSFEKKSALFNSGAEAVENAVKIARYATGRQAIVVLESAYHGRTNLTMAMTAKNMPFKHGFGPFAPEVYRLPGSNPLEDGLDGRAAAERTIWRIEKEIGGANLAAIVVEPVQGEGGFIVPALGFLSGLADYAKGNGALLIADEIQSGFCRTGKWFASEHHGLEPDLVITAKGIAGGMPLSAVTGKAEIMDKIHPGGLGGTYTGNPVACAAAVAAIEWMRRNDANSLANGIELTLKAHLSKLKNKHSEIAEIRGMGAMVAMEFLDPRSGRAMSEEVAKIAATCHKAGVVVLTSGMQANVIRFLPPLSITVDLLEKGLEILSTVIDQVVTQP